MDIFESRHNTFNAVRESRHAISSLPSLIDKQLLFSSRYKNCIQSIKKNLRFIYVSDKNLHDLQNAIQNKSAVIVGNGSYLPHTHIATAGVVVTDENKIDKIRVQPQLPGQDTGNDSIRAEIFSLILGMLVMEVVCQWYGINEGGFTICCDNDTALLFGVTYQYLPKVGTSHFDLLSSLHWLRSKCNLTIIYLNVNLND